MVSNRYCFSHRSNFDAALGTAEGTGGEKSQPKGLAFSLPEPGLVLFTRHRQLLHLFHGLGLNLRFVHAQLLIQRFP